MSTIEAANPPSETRVPDAPSSVSRKLGPEPRPVPSLIPDKTKPARNARGHVNSPRKTRFVEQRGMQHHKHECATPRGQPPPRAPPPSAKRKEKPCDPTPLPLPLSNRQSSPDSNHRGGIRQSPAHGPPPLLPVAFSYKFPPRPPLVDAFFVFFTLVIYVLDLDFRHGKNFQIATRGEILTTEKRENAACRHA